MIELGPISSIFYGVGVAISPLEGIPIIGGIFFIFDFIMGFIAGVLTTYGLK